MGGFYARHDGEDGSVAAAIEEHYQPRGAADAVAPSKLGAVVALADRLDTLVGCFAVGLRPSGSEDPFGLRRVAIGTLRTLLHHRASLSLAEALGAAWDVYADENGRMVASAAAAKATRDDTVRALVDFAAERLRGLLDERFPRDVVAACMAASRDNPFDVFERAEGLATFWETPAAADLAVAFKRVFNISRDAPGGALTDADRALLTRPTEVALVAAFEGTQRELAPLFAARRFVEALELIARALRPPVDALFAPGQPLVRDGTETEGPRLRLLRTIADAVGGFARFDALE